MKEIISYLRIQLTVAWLNLNMPNQTLKNGLKAKKIKLPQINFFLKKLLIKFSCTYQPLSFCKTLKKFLEVIQSYEDVPFSGPKWPICPDQIVLVQTIITTFIYLLALFIVQNFKKFFKQIQSCEDVQFLGPKWSICPKFFLENYYHSHLPTSPFHCVKFQKNSSSGSRVMWMHNFWAQNGPFP